MSGGRIEVVRGQLSREQAEAVLAFWRGHGATDEAQARAFLPQVMGLLLDEQDGLIGTSAVVSAELELLGHQHVWIHQPLVRPGLPDAVWQLFRASFAALEQRFDHKDPAQPIGLVELLSDPVERRHRREAAWTDPETAYAGYLPGGVQVRVAWFSGARALPRGPGAVAP